MSSPLTRRVPLGVLISGGGTNLQAIIDAIEERGLAAQIRVVISNRSDAYGLTRARNDQIPTEIVEHESFAGREAFDQILIEKLQAHGVELVILAGFMRLLSPLFVRAFPNRTMNIHPALLPAFPGLHAQKQAVEYGVRFSGCTVHFVTEDCDQGPVIIQAVVPVFPGDTEESLTTRILHQEHRIYPMAIRLYSEGRLRIEGRKVFVEGWKAEEGLVLVQPPANG